MEKLQTSQSLSRVTGSDWEIETNRLAWLQKQLKRHYKQVLSLGKYLFAMTLKSMTSHSTQSARTRKPVESVQTLPSAIV